MLSTSLTIVLSKTLRKKAGTGQPVPAHLTSNITSVALYFTVMPVSGTGGVGHKKTSPVMGGVKMYSLHLSHLVMTFIIWSAGRIRYIIAIEVLPVRERYNMVIYDQFTFVRGEYMKQAFTIIITHLSTLIAVLVSAELFNKADISGNIMLISLSLLLIYYLGFYALKLKYIPKSNILISFCDVIIWFILLNKVNSWTNLIGWDRFIYIVYPFIEGSFFLCLLTINFIICIIKRKKKMQI